MGGCVYIGQPLVQSLNQTMCCFGGLLLIVEAVAVERSSGLALLQPIQSGSKSMERGCFWAE
jgi:hypothetical protein